MQRERIRLCLVSVPGPVRDATWATLAQCEGVRVVAAASGALSATQIVPHLRPDVILLDANLPDEEVIALLQWLVEHYPTARRVVTAVTSGQIHQALAFGANAAIRRDELPTGLMMYLG